jgi:hypothetical protein
MRERFNMEEARNGAQGKSHQERNKPYLSWVRGEQCLSGARVPDMHHFFPLNGFEAPLFHGKNKVVNP